MTGTGTYTDLWVGLIAFVLIGGGAWYLTGIAERKRHERNRAFAATMGWDYLSEDPSLIESFESQPFGLGRSRRATDVMRGMVRDREFVVFGYRYVEGFGKSRTVYNLRVCTVQVPGGLPLVCLSPENPATRLASAFGGRDVEVESEEFNRRWRVWSREERVAHAILTPTMIERFLDDDLNWKTVTFEPGFLIMCENGELDLPFTPLPLDTLCDIANLVPKFLFDDYR